jgi:hypothetical protein
MGEEGRVSFYKISREFILLNNVEELRAGAELLQRHFWVFSSHDDRRILSSFRRSLACFYTCSIPSPGVLREKGFDVREVDFKVPVEDSIFFDQRSQSLDLSLFRPQPVVCILVQGQRAGIYFVRDEVLIGTDWTHNMKCIRTLSQLVPYLSSIFRKKPKTPPKPRFVLKFGADPEFEVVNLAGKVVSASGIIDGGTDPRQEI